MNDLNKTQFVNAKTADKKWHLVDAEGQILGRLACDIVRILTGKKKADYTPHYDSGDYVIVINADKIVLSGKEKAKQLQFYRHTGYPSGLRVETLEQLMQRMPEKALSKIVHKMLPKGTNMRSTLIKKLKVYAGSTHPHSAQVPVLMENK